MKLMPAMHKHIALLWTSLLLLSVSMPAALAGADAAEPLANLETAHERVRKQLAAQVKRALAGGAADLHLVLEGAADGDTALVQLTQRGGAWWAGDAVVPYWRQEAQKEKFSFLHRDGVVSTTRDKFYWPLRTDDLQLRDGRLTGETIIEFRRRWTRDELMPPGLQHLTTMDGRWSLMDQWRIVPHDRPQPQRFSIDAHMLDGVTDLHLTLHAGIDGKPIHIQTRVPARPWEQPKVTAPTFNAGVHSADVSDLRIEDGKLTGDVKLRLGPDPWYPKNAHHVTCPLIATINGTTLSGTFEAKVTRLEDVGNRVSGQSRGRKPRTGPVNWSGKLTGTARQAMTGRYTSQGAFGTYGGRVLGGMSQPNDPLAAFTPPNELTADATPQSRSDRAWRLYEQVRAMQVASAHDPLAASSLLQQQLIPAPQWPETDAAKHVETLIAQLGAYVNTIGTNANPINGYPRSDDAKFGPYYDTAVLETDEAGRSLLPEDIDNNGAQRWQTPAGWHVLGPFPTRSTARDVDSALPPVIFAASAGYAADVDALGGNFRAPDDGLLRWEATPTLDGALHPPAWTWNRKGQLGDEPGRPDSTWFAATSLVCKDARQVWVAVEAHDFGRLWVNGRLAWVASQRELGHRQAGPAVFRISLRAGENRLLMQCRDDRGGSWLRFAVSTQGQPQDTLDPDPPAPQPQKARDAAPPLAWDLTTGRNVQWQTPLGSSKAQLLVAGDRVFAVAEPFTLICLDRATGKEMWQRSTNALELIDADAFKQWAKATTDEQRLAILHHHTDVFGRARSLGDLHSADPVTDGKHVYVHHAGGVVACYDFDGKRRWSHRTLLSEASLRLHAGRLIIEGAPADNWAKHFEIDGDVELTSSVRRAGGHFYAGHDAHAKRIKQQQALRKKRHGMLAIDTASGKQAWATAAYGAYAGRPFAMTLTHGDKAQPVVVTRSGQVLAAATGRTLVHRMDLPDDWDWLGAVQSGSMLLTAHEGGRHAARLWLDAHGQVGHRLLWRGIRHHAYVAGGPNHAVATHDRLLVWRRMPEHAKHDPAYALMLDCFDRATGDHVTWIKPVMRGTNVSAHPVVAGEYVYLADRRGGPHTGGSPQQRQIAVVRLDPQPVVVARNDAPNLNDPPVFADGQMFLRLGADVVCIAVDDNDGRQFQQQRVANTVLDDLPSEPTTPQMRTVKPLDIDRLPANTPVTQFDEGATIIDWLVAGPFAPHDAGKAPLQLTTDADALPQIGTKLTLADEARPFTWLDRELLTHETRFVNDSRLDDWQLRRSMHRIDVSGLAGDRSDGVVYLYTLLENPRERLVVHAMPSPGTTVVLAGEQVAAGEPVRLLPGRYPLLIALQPKRFQRQVPQPPTDVLAALKVDALKPIGWPTQWQAFGPIPEAAGALSSEQLEQVRDKVTLAGQEYNARILKADDYFVDLTALVDGGENERVSQTQVACAMATIDCPADGYVVINATADWFMAWSIDGKPVYSTLGSGNRMDPRQLTAHSFRVAVGKGKHTIAVTVKPGSKGWSFTAAGGFTAEDPLEVGRKFAAKKGRRAAEAEYRIAPSFREVEHPDAVLAAWQSYIDTRSSTLEWLNKFAPDHADQISVLLKAAGHHPDAGP